MEWSVYNEQENIWKEAIMTWFGVSSWHLPGGTEETHDSLSQKFV
jgi:hypothetical protein